ncbi:hypothetical protein Pmani_034311 [Petrolisthes manimaculis]|uniref:Uncharacterized protein n=1 Tax=Petrolisthes manimaculis TaxID=1843537 RepID=A0AAE1TRP4_9EUCA|nr:hypothetical protein Pmani_034311 [Petrolisthes manimaculis]
MARRTLEAEGLKQRGDEGRTLSVKGKTEGGWRGVVEGRLSWQGKQETAKTRRGLRMEILGNTRVLYHAAGIKQDKCSEGGEERGEVLVVFVVVVVGEEVSALHPHYTVALPNICLFFPLKYHPSHFLLLLLYFLSTNVLLLVSLQSHPSHLIPPLHPTPPSLPLPSQMSRLSYPPLPSIPLFTNTTTTIPTCLSATRT